MFLLEILSQSTSWWFLPHIQMNSSVCVHILPSGNPGWLLTPCKAPHPSAFMGHWGCCASHLLLSLLLILGGVALVKQALTTTDWLSSGCQTSRNPQLLFNGRTKPVLWNPKARVTNMMVSRWGMKPPHLEPGLPSNSQCSSVFELQMI